MRRALVWIVALLACLGAAQLPPGLTRGQADARYSRPTLKLLPPRAYVATGTVVVGAGAASTYPLAASVSVPAAMGGATNPLLTFGGQAGDVGTTVDGGFGAGTWVNNHSSIDGTPYPYWVEFQQYGSSMEYLYFGRGSANQRVSVNGLYAEDVYNDPGAGNSQIIRSRTVSFFKADGTTADVAWHTVHIDFADNAFIGVNPSSGGAIQPSATKPLKWSVFSDSFEQGAYVGPPGTPIYYVADLIGGDTVDVCLHARGGTGILAGSQTYRQRLSELAADRPTDVFFRVSINDAGYTPSALIAEMKYLVAYAKALPSRPRVWVLGVAQRNPISTALTAIDNAFSAASDIGAPYLRVAPLYTPAILSLAVGGDGAHPIAMGVQLEARAYAAAMVAYTNARLVSSIFGPTFAGVLEDRYASIEAAMREASVATR